MYELTVTRGPDQGKAVRLSPGDTSTVGASPDDSLVLTDPKVLDRHCSVKAAPGQVVLENHTASAGTFIGEKRIDRVALKPGMSFRVGDTLIGLRALERSERRTGPDPLIGKIIGGYKLNEVVGAGGMGTVYKATQLSLHRDVALKVLRPSLAKDQAFVDMFVAEARSAAQLVDPNIVQIYDAGTEGDVCYFAMEYIGQGSVEEILERDKKVAWEEAILMVLEAAHGLLYAEGKSIVHRDIKPDNLMINDDGRIKIADLGLAKRGGGDTKSQGIIGTPHFIPPEQALGKETDTRADIYSLGATFFRMITGKTVFSGKTAKEIVLKHIKEPAPAASSLEPSIPDELDAAIARMLAKDPDARFQNVHELIAALESICAHYGIKGSIIRKGLSKKVLIPVAILTLAAVGIAIYFATKKPETIVDKAAQERARVLEEQRKKDQQRLAENERKLRRSNSENELQGLHIKAGRLNPIDETYDSGDADQSAALEKSWLDMADEYDTFAKRELAREFGNDIPAREAAKTIRTDLAGFKEVQADKRAWIAARVQEAEDIDKKLREQIAEARRTNRYGDVVNLCDLATADEPGKDDPFRAVESAVWTSGKLKPVTAKRNNRIMKIITDSRRNMKKEKPIIAREAAAIWDAVAEKDAALKKQPMPSDADIRAVMAEAKGIAESFPARTGETPKTITDIVTKAERIQHDWEQALKRNQELRLASDRQLVRDMMRKQRSRSVGAIPNLVMEGDIAGAIDGWQQRLQRGELQTERYKRFAKEQIEMLRWVQYVYWRFHEDTKASLEEKDGGPFRTTALDLPKEGSPGKTYQDRLDAVDDDIYKFGFTKRIKGELSMKFGQMPMDWVYHAAFHHRGEPRWRDMTPVLEFGLGVFCLETMQYEFAIPHFQKLATNGIAGGEKYVATAKLLLVRAQAEQAAYEEYKAILAVHQKENATSADVQNALRQLNTFAERHGGTLFYLDIMRLRDNVLTDVDEPALPTLPPAPPQVVGDK